MKSKRKNFSTLTSIVRKLRSPSGCPWDRKQDINSLKSYLLEEVYELIEAIDRKDVETIRYELGDLMLQIVLASQIASEKGWFNVHDVIESICTKLTERHPHVFGTTEVNDASEVLKLWCEKKMQNEKSSGSVLNGIPKNLPALKRAELITRRASSVGFDWRERDDVIEKVKEEVGEFFEAIRSKKGERIEEEFGDLLFTLVNLSRFLNICAEDSLQLSNSKFIERFKELERSIRQMGMTLDEVGLELMDEIWESKKGRSHHRSE
jgi:tetrapyrrole methylase family protein/MazG family protein